MKYLTLLSLLLLSGCCVHKEYDPETGELIKEHYGFNEFSGGKEISIFKVGQ